MSQHDEEATIEQQAAYAWVLIADWSETLTPPEIAKAWVTGLRAAGAREVRQMFYKPFNLSLPMVVEFECPEWHEGDVQGTFAKVRLLVRRDGWVEFYQGAVMPGDESPKPGTRSCTKCTGDLVATYLVTCSPCAEDADDHPEHDAFYDEPPPGTDLDPAELHDAQPTDESPFAHVLAEVNRAVGRRLGYLSGTSAKRPGWTVESVMRWLDERQIDPRTAQSPTWEVVRQIEEHPPQSMVRAAQARRKRSAS